MIRRPPRSTHCISSAASDVYKRQVRTQYTGVILIHKVLLPEQTGAILLPQQGRTVRWGPPYSFHDRQRRPLDTHLQSAQAAILFPRQTKKVTRHPPSVRWGRHSLSTQTENVTRHPPSVRRVRRSPSTQTEKVTRHPPSVRAGRHRPSTTCLLYTSPSPRDGLLSRMPSSA